MTAIATKGKGIMEERDDRQIITPHYKMILAYDIRPTNPEGYYQFILGEFVPALQNMDIYMAEAWHTAYGEHPMRMITFVAEEYNALQDMFESEEWDQLESKLLLHVRNYSCKVVEYKAGFQLVK